MTIICHREAQLLKRNEKLEELWELDCEIRKYHSDGEWKVSPAAETYLKNLIEQRHACAAEVLGLGATPWDFHPTRDNSWLVTPRGESVGRAAS